MNQVVLKNIKDDIKKNFGKSVNWNNMRNFSYNCYMYAIFDTVPTEILIEKKDGKKYNESVIGDTIFYFADIGQISGRTEFYDTSELVEALKYDLLTLGINLEKSSFDEVVPREYIKIAFFYDVKALIHGKHSNFHFVRQEGNKWMHKCGWEGAVEEVNLKNVTFGGLELIGYFRLNLIKDHS